MAEDKTFTQEEVNKLVGQARLEGKEAGRKEFEGWISKEELDKQTSSLSDQIKALTDEKTNLQTQLTEKNGQIAKYEIDSVKTKIARECGLPYGAADFLQGDSEETIRQSAELMKGLMGTSQQPSFNQEPGNGNAADVAWKELAKNIL